MVIDKTNRKHDDDTCAKLNKSMDVEKPEKTKKITTSRFSFDKLPPRTFVFFLILKTNHTLSSSINYAECFYTQNQEQEKFEKTLYSDNKRNCRRQTKVSKFQLKIREKLLKISTETFSWQVLLQRNQRNVDCTSRKVSVVILMNNTKH